jgi:hypothetical protein
MVRYGFYEVTIFSSPPDGEWVARNKAGKRVSKHGDNLQAALIAAMKVFTHS